MKHLCRLTLPLLLCAAPVGAQPAPADAAGLPAAAVSAQQPTLPLSIDLLPYGTVVLTEGPSHGSYYIPNFQNTGVAIYVQSPRPLRVATLDEMVRAQAEWTRATLGLGRAAPSSATRAPAPASPPSADALQARQATSPGQPVPGAPAPAAAQATAETRVPAYLRPTFRGRSGTGTYTITYSIMNTSRAESVSLDPGRLRLTQGGQPLPAQFSMRDSSGGDSGVLMPRSALIGTVTVRARSQDPIVLNWTARDAQGRDYPIAYTWQPR